MSSSPFPYFVATKASIGYKVFSGIITVMALIEFFLFTLGFLYCLIRTAFYQTVGGKFLSGFVAVFFTFTRLFTLVLLIANVPLPGNLNSIGNSKMISGSLWTLGVLFFIILFTQMVIVVTHEIYRLHKRKSKVNPISIPDHRKSYVSVIIPIYNEDPAQLWSTLISVSENKYPHDKLNIILAFDDYEESDVYLATKKFIESDISTVIDENLQSEISLISEHKYLANEKHNIIFYQFRGNTLTLCRFNHGGKRETQNKAFIVAEKWYHKITKDNEAPFQRNPKHHEPLNISELILLFIDSDVVLHRSCISHMEQVMRVNPTRRAVTGLILCSIPKTNFLWILQEIEYVQAQMIDRVVESVMGGVTCLPGALTMVRYHALKSVAPLYFGWKTMDKLDTFEYSKYYLGEDRYLTSLLLDSSSSKKEISFCEDAMSETVAPSKFSTFMKQRRRWFLGTLANEAQLLTSTTSYTRFPILTIYRLILTSTRSLSLLYYVLIVSIISDHKPIWALVCAIVIPIAFNWIAVGYYGITLRSYCCLLYPIFHVIFPIYQWIITVYALLTCNKRTWGGPRTTKNKKDKNELVLPKIIKYESTNAFKSEDKYNSDVFKNGNKHYSEAYLADTKSEVFSGLPVGQYADASFTSVSEYEDNYNMSSNNILENMNEVDIADKSFFDDEYNKMLYADNFLNSSKLYRSDNDTSSITTITKENDNLHKDKSILNIVENMMKNHKNNRISMMARVDDDVLSLNSNNSISTIIKDTNIERGIENNLSNYAADGFGSHNINSYDYNKNNDTINTSSKYFFKDEANFNNNVSNLDISFSQFDVNREAEVEPEYSFEHVSGLYSNKKPSKLVLNNVNHDNNRNSDIYSQIIDTPTRRSLRIAAKRNGEIFEINSDVLKSPMLTSPNSNTPTRRRVQSPK